jgi:hypothetical protein
MGRFAGGLSGKWITKWNTLMKTVNFRSQKLTKSNSFWDADKINLFHLVDVKPWPILGSLRALTVISTSFAL